jgi:hypothetical protein
MLCIFCVLGCGINALINNNNNSKIVIIVQYAATKNAINSRLYVIGYIGAAFLIVLSLTVLMWSLTVPVSSPSCLWQLGGQQIVDTATDCKSAN